jgi:hypothetical protein
MSRLVGSVEISSWEKLVATCAVCVRTSAELPTTFTVSESVAGPIVTFSGTVWVGATAIVRC